MVDEGGAHVGDVLRRRGADPVAALGRFWDGNVAAAAMVEGFRKLSLTGRLGAMSDVVDACVFLLENSLANSIDLRLDGGRP